MALPSGVVASLTSGGPEHIREASSHPQALARGWLPTGSAPGGFAVELDVTAADSGHSLAVAVLRLAVTGSAPPYTFSVISWLVHTPVLPPVLVSACSRRRDHLLLPWEGSLFIGLVSPVPTSWLLERRPA